MIRLDKRKDAIDDLNSRIKDTIKYLQTDITYIMSELDLIQADIFEILNEDSERVDVTDIIYDVDENKVTLNIQSDSLDRHNVNLSSINDYNSILAIYYTTTYHFKNRNICNTGDIVDTITVLEGKIRNELVGIKHSINFITTHYIDIMKIDGVIKCNIGDDVYFIHYIENINNNIILTIRNDDGVELKERLSDCIIDSKNLIRLLQYIKTDLEMIN